MGKSSLPMFWQNTRANSFVLQGPHQGSWKQPNFTIRSLSLSLPNLVIETAFAQREEGIRRKVQLWLEGSQGLMQVAIVVKMRRVRSRWWVKDQGYE